MQQTKRDIFKETIEKWGVESQIWMAMEEMGELMTALSHYFRGRIDKDEVAEEIADVMLMAEEMAYIFGRERVDHRLDLKKKIVTKCLDDTEFRPAHEIIAELQREGKI